MKSLENRNDLKKHFGSITQKALLLHRTPLHMSVLFIDSEINMVVHFILLLSKGAFAVNNNIITYFLLLRNISFVTSPTLVS